MPTAGGPNTLGESNLVFAYDTGDIRNSYIGEPTVNYQWNGGSEVTPWTVNGTNTDVSNTSERGPVKGAKTWKFEKTGGSNQWNGWESNYGGIWTGNSGDIWTTSYWYKTTAPAGNTGFGVGYFYTSDWSRPYNTTILANVSDIIADGQWHYNYTVTQFNENYSNAIVVDGPSWGYSYSAGVLYINGLQWEKKSHPTPFAYGTRSVTQGLLPLIGTSTLDLLNVSFDSNAQIVFDGTNDYVDTNSNSLITGTNPFTIESITNKTAGSYGAILGNYGPGYNQLWWASAGLYLGGDLYHSDYSNTMAGWHYSAVTRDSSGNAKLYRDGILVNTTILTASVPSNINWRIGANVNGGGEPFTGNIPVIKVYNNVLTADQIKQNYQQYKTRFNLS